jgi:actin related protein 2/3 complex subunit 1A/1B
LTTLHQNTITEVRPYEIVGGEVAKVSTSGVDGMLVIWDANEISALTSKLGGARLG